MKNELNMYVLFMAVTLPLQYIAVLILPDVSLMEILFESESTNKLSVLSEYLVTASVASALLFLPGLISAIWIYRIRSISIKYKWAWLVVGLFLEYFVLLFYIAGQLLEKSNIVDNEA